MTDLDIARQRLANQRLSGAKFDKPDDIVRWLGAVQSQDYAGAKWALGLRLNGASEAVLDQAFNEGAFLRTHVMRPTWHFVAPEDIRWLLALTAPRVHALSAYYYRQLELDDAFFARCDEVLVGALQGGKHLMRTELIEAFDQAGIVTKELLRFNFIMIHAELEGLVCSGARRGKQQTYALLDERVPPGRSFTRDEALAELTRRYFTSHGPAALKDFAWWSGLTVADAKAGVEMVKAQLCAEEIDGAIYWFGDSLPMIDAVTPRAYLLPNFDEYTVGYADRSAIIDPQHAELVDMRSGILDYVIVVDGQVVGSWKRTVQKQAVTVELRPFAPLTSDQQAAVTSAAERYGEFLGLPVVLA